MRILVVGAGATGGFYGGRMAQAGRDVTFLVRGARLAKLRESGLQIVSPLGDATVHPKLMTAEELKSSAPFDMVVLTVKAYSLKAAMDDVAPAVGEGTVIVPLLNGLQHLALLQERFGKEKVLGSACRIGGDMDADGRVLQMSKLGEVLLGPVPGAGTSADAVQRAYEAFSVPLVPTTLSDDGLEVLWQKWWFLASFGAVCILGRGSVGEVAAAPHGAEMSLAITEEAKSIAEANGIRVSQALLEENRKMVSSVAAKSTSSLYRDMTRGLPVEADAILGDFIARAKGVPVPLLTAAYVQLKVYEAARKA